MLIDAHCHFDFDCFNTDREACWQRCQDQGIGALIIPGVEPAQWQRVERLCEQMPLWHFTVGLHPVWLSGVHCKASALVEQLEAHLGAKNCVGIGECGLDATIDTPIDEQIVILEAHLHLAQKYGLPVVLHCVKAQNPLLQCLKNFPAVFGVVHGFSGSLQTAEQFWQKGFYLGVGGVITYSRASKTRAAITGMPLDSLLLETDAPDMPLSGGQGKRNSPEYLPQVARELAALKQLTAVEVATATTANTCRLFDRLKLTGVDG